MKYDYEDTDVRSRMDDVVRAIQALPTVSRLSRIQWPYFLTKADWVQCHPKML